MNWDGTLYTGRPKGLQLEAFGVQVPRRTDGVSSALNWNYAAHLDPMFRFKDAYGTPDLEKVEELSWEERQRLDYIYSQLQSSNYGQEVANGLKMPNKGVLRIYPNPASSSETVYIDFPENNNYTYNELEIYNQVGDKVYAKKIASGLSNCSLNVEKIHSGLYIVKLKGNGMNWTDKMIVY
jgi:hypothetical protein